MNKQSFLKLKKEAKKAFLLSPFDEFVYGYVKGASKYIDKMNRKIRELKRVIKDISKHTDHKKCKERCLGCKFIIIWDEYR